MKALMFFLLSAALLGACKSDNDFAKPESKLPTVESLQAHIAGDYDISNQQRSPVTINYCVQVSASSGLLGVGSYMPLRQATPAEESSQAISNRVPTGLYVIEAKGDAVSQDYARGTSEIKLEFNTRTNQVSGTMITKFHGGEILEQRFDGKALVVYDRYSMILRAKVQKAQFSESSEILNLVHGEIVIALPIDPIGWFEMNVYHIGMFCTDVPS